MDRLGFLISRIRVVTLRLCAGIALFALTICWCCGQTVEAPRGIDVGAISDKLTSSSVANWHVFLVAVKDYNEDISPVLYTDDDVQALYERFIKFNVPPENILILSKSQRAHNYYPTKDHIITEFKRYLSRLDENSIAFVYFSGHGFNDKIEGEEKSFFAPIDFERSSSDAAKGAICLNDDILAELAKSDAPFSWLCVDACCSYLSRKRDSDVGLDFSIGNIPTGILFQQSCEDGKPAYEYYQQQVVEFKKAEIEKLGIDLSSPDLKHGLFTKSLLEALDPQKAYADSNKDGVVTLSEVLNYVERHVDEDAVLFHNNNQRPRHKVNEAKKLDDYILLPDVSIKGYVKSDWEKGRKLVEEARKHIKKEEYEEAVDMIQEARILLPTEFATDEVDALYGLALKSRQGGDLSYALTTIDEALRIDANSSKCQRLKGAIERDLNQPKPAAEKPAIEKDLGQPRPAAEKPAIEKDLDQPRPAAEKARVVTKESTIKAPSSSQRHASGVSSRAITKKRLTSPYADWQVLLIGVTEYDSNQVSSLPSVGDAPSLKEALLARGVPEENILTLESGGNFVTAPTKENVLRSLNELALRLTEESTAFVYFSGRGVSSDSVSYFDPQDAEPEKSGTVKNETLIPLTFIVQELSRKTAKFKCVTFDLSYCGGVLEELGGNYSDVAVLSACKGDQEAMIDIERRNISLFTLSLVRLLEEKSDVWLGDLFELTTIVEETSMQQFKRRQTPAFYFGDYGEDYLIFPDPKR